MNLWLLAKVERIYWDEEVCVLRLPENFVPPAIVSDFPPANIKKGDTVVVIAYNCRIEAENLDKFWDRLDSEEREEIVSKIEKPTISDLYEIFLPNRKIIAPGVIEHFDKSVAHITSSIFYGSTGGLVLKLEDDSLQAIGRVLGIVWEKSLNKVFINNDKFRAIMKIYL